MEFQYYKDAKHNYLILEAEVNDENLFQYKMLENNRIDGLLPFSLRNMDECYYLYYEIDSRQSIKNRYDKKRMSYDNLVRLLSDLVQTSKNLDDYLLDSKHLMLVPETIFEDFSTGRYYFIYDPIHEKVIDQTFFGSLMEFVDFEDERCSKLLSDLVETICDESGIDFCILDKALRSESQPEFREDTASFGSYKEIYETKVSMNERRDIKDFIDEDFDNDEDEDYEANLEEEAKKIKIHLPVGMNFVLSALFAIIAGALWYLRYAYILTYEENILDLSFFIISVMMSLSCFIMQLRKNDKVFGRNKKAVDTRKTKEDTLKNISIEAYEDKIKMVEKADRPVFPDEDDEENEETVLLGFDFNNNNHKLYAKEGTEHENIGLQNLPIVVGKLASCADAVIKDKSVSRMHAKIYRLDQHSDSLWIQDLNSTNGTFINGRKLMPNEKAELSEDDEVAFGKCVFAYR